MTCAEVFQNTDKARHLVAKKDTTESCGGQMTSRWLKLKQSLSSSTFHRLKTAFKYAMNS